MRFVGALEELLDPIVAVLDGLPQHFDPNHAPPDILGLLAAWLGVDLDETQDIKHQREMVRRSAELGRRRGTVKGLELALKLHFPEVPMRVEDNGGVIWHGRPAPAEKPSASFVVYCDMPVDETMQAAIARCIEQYKPVHSTYRLRVKAAKKKVRVMRTCQSCGKENPADRDFCSCGEYLRWEPTGFVQAITPEMAAEAAAQAAPPKAPEPEPPPPRLRRRPRASRPPPRPRPSSGNGHGNGHAAAPPPAPPAPPPPTIGSLPAVAQRAAARAAAAVAKTLVRGAVPAQPPAAAPPQANEPATIVLRLPDGDPAKGETLHQAVEPGQRERVLALVRNQSGIVDNYDLRVEGMPQDWWSIYPGTVYLVPFGSGGTYEQEVEVHLHPPRGPEAEARVWELQVVADSKAHQIVAASAPLALHIEPYIETATTLRPQRKKGRRKATFDVTVANKANAPVLIALDGEDPDGELQFGFNRPPQEIPPGAAGDLADAGQAAQADLDRPPAGAPAGGQDRHRRGGRRARRRRAAERRRARAGAAAGQAQVVQAPGAAGPGRLRTAHLQAAALPAGRQHGPGRPQRADAAVPRAAGPGPADGPAERFAAGQARRAQAARAAAGRRRRPRRCCRPRASSASGRGCRGG